MTTLFAAPRLRLGLGATLALLSCSSPAPKPAPSEPPPATPPPRVYGDVPRGEFNRAAQELTLPLFWTEDANADGKLDPAELVVLWGHGASWGDYVKDGAFTPGFTAAYDRIAALHKDGHAFAGPDAERKKVMLEELRQGWPTGLVYALPKDASPEDRAIVKHVLAAAEWIEKIYAKQIGADRAMGEIDPADTVSRAVAHRNQGPWCEGPTTEKNELCNATTTKAKQIFGLYPESLQAEKGFCDKLTASKDPAMIDHFNVVREEGGKLVTVPYTVAFKTEMDAIANELSQAAAAIASPEEAAFKAYLEAAAQAFRDNVWGPADEAWSKMNVNNSKWYLRIGPDETYFEPCNLRAGFHASFARINQGSLKWQEKLVPHRDTLEGMLAKLAGPPYKARKVSFHLPDFIDIIVNAGDSRSAFGATIGQSLPNWGKVADEGRGRTVAMTNLYTDADSQRFADEQARSLLCADTYKLFDPKDPEPLVLSTVLHEAAHNLGPAHDYKVNGKNDDQIFGGPLASMLEEFKSQTAAMYFTPWMAEAGLIPAEMADKMHVKELFWAFGHISRGMWTAEGKSKPYSQLAGIQLGHLLKTKAVEWRAEEPAVNGTDKGCFTIRLDKQKDASTSLMKIAAQIKGKGDKKTALALVDEHIGKPGEVRPLHQTIAERLLRTPRASFVYAVKTE